MPVFPLPRVVCLKAMAKKARGSRKCFRPLTWPPRSSVGWPTSRSRLTSLEPTARESRGAVGTARHKPVVAARAAVLLDHRRGRSFGRDPPARTASRRRPRAAAGVVLAIASVWIEAIQRGRKLLRRRDAVSRGNLAYREYSSTTTSPAGRRACSPAAPRILRAPGSGRTPDGWATSELKTFPWSEPGAHVLVRGVLSGRRAGGRR